MARIFELTRSRGHGVCDKCGKIIMPGDHYLKATPYMKKPIIRCTECGLMNYETSGSSYIKSAGALRYEWQKKYTIDNDIVDHIINDIEDIKGDIEYNLDGIPEQLQDSSILQDRINSLEDCLNDLESINISEDDEDFKENIINDINAALSNILLR